MLAPDNRALLLDALRPPPGHSLDHAVATTFTLDLETALMVPLAFAGFQFDAQPDPIEVMESLRGMTKRFDVFCQAGAINAGKWPSDLLALLENVVHGVRRPRPGHIFHPKVWVLRFLDRSQEPSFRLLVLSRNLTADRGWDTILRLDGRLERQPIASHAPLTRFVAALSGLTVTQLPPARRAKLAALAEELNRVHWDRPDGVREARFHPIGLPGSPQFPVEEHFSGYRKLTISPFVSDGAIRRLLRPRAGQKTVLVSRGEELAALQPDSLNHLEVYELDPTANLSADDVDDVEEGTSQTFLTHLHAKIFAIERARLAHLFVGSANATDAGFNGGNIEFLCELIGPVGRLGVDAIVGEDAPLHTMLTPYVASERPEINEASTARRALEDLLLDIAGGVRFRTTVTQGLGGWVPRVTSEPALPHFPEGTSVTIAPHNRPAETCPLSPVETADIELTPRELADVTPFLQLTARRMVNGKTVEHCTVICSQLDGAPDDRIQEIMARQIDTTEKFLRLLILLIGFASGSSSEVATSVDGPGSWSSGAGQGFLELLARALSERPESIDHLESIVDHLRRRPNGSAVLPQGWDDVWLPALEARREMLEQHS